MAAGVEPLLLGTAVNGEIPCDKLGWTRFPIQDSVVLAEEGLESVSPTRRGYFVL